MRRVSRKEVAMTDLTANGSRIYDKHTLIEINSGIYKGGQLDRIFLGLNTEDILAKAKEIFNKATQHQISLAVDDALSLVVHTDGKWDIIVLDLDGVKIGSPRAESLNEVGFELFKEDIKGLKNEIKKYSAKI